MSNKKSLISTAIAYGNANPHIGHAFEFVLADTITRYKKQSEDIFFVTGMDEHGQKIEQKAKELGVTPQELTQKSAQAFINLDKELSVDYNFFVRTSNKEKHYTGAQFLWRKLVDANAIEKRKYKALYCIGCEEFKTEKDLNDAGECPLHRKAPEMIEEENYFFKLSEYGTKIREKIATDELKIYPESRKNEILAFLDRGLEDVSFSRPKSKVAWGIPVPGDDTQVMYVWCDALSNYITALGYGTDVWKEKNEYWNDATHIIGKDILRFHAAIWPGMLLAAGLPLPKRILVHGFITSGGQKMSKTLGNVIDPQELLEMFRGSCGELAGDALRFVLLHEIPTFDDGDVTMETIKASYTAHLANGIGNLTNRIMKMATSNKVSFTPELNDSNPLEETLEVFNIKKALEILMLKVGAIDLYIQTNEPFKKIKVEKTKDEALKEMSSLLKELHKTASLLAVFMPSTSAKILDCIRENKMPEKPLFARIA